MATTDSLLNTNDSATSTNLNISDPDREGRNNPNNNFTNDDQVIFTTTTRSSRIARMGATINILSTAIGGGGMFGNIFGASQLGIIGFIIVTFLSATFTFCAIQFLCISSQISKKYSCYALSQEFMGGKKGDVITKLFIIFGNWSYIVNIIQIFADFMEFNLPIWTQVNNGNFFVSREFAVILGLFFIFPFITVQNIKHLENLSGIFLFFACAILLVIILNAFSAITLNEVSPSIQFIATDYYAIFRGLAPITWCWTVQFNVLPVYMTLNPSTRNKQMISVSWWTVSLLFIYYIIFGISAMIIWGNKINDDFITNLDYNNNNYVFYYGIPLSTATQFIMVLITFSSIPIYAFEARVNFHYILTDLYWCCFARCFKRDEDSGNDEDERTALLRGTNDDISVNGTGSTESVEVMMVNNVMMRSYTETSTSRFIEGTVLITTAAICSLKLRDLNWSLGLVGATYGCYIAYLIPSVVFLRVVWDKTDLSRKYGWFKWMAVGMFGYGVVVCVLGVTAAFL